MRYFILLIGVCAGCVACAQNKMEYAGNITGGWLVGSKPYSGFVTTEQGVAFGQYRFGIGSGYDFYRIRSVPLYAAFSRSFTHNPIQPFISAAAGLNLVSPTGSEKTQIFYYNYTGSFLNGLYAKAGGGLMLRANKKWQFALLAGYNYKSATYVYKRISGQPWPTEEKPIEDKYHLKRWYVGAGISW